MLPVITSLSDVWCCGVDGREDSEIVKYQMCSKNMHLVFWLFQPILMWWTVSHSYCIFIRLEVTCICRQVSALMFLSLSSVFLLDLIFIYCFCLDIFLMVNLKWSLAVTLWDDPYSRVRVLKGEYCKLSKKYLFFFVRSLKRRIFFQKAIDFYEASLS